MTHPELPIPLSGSIVILGPSNVGKTRMTAEALHLWIEQHGQNGVVVLDFAPEAVRDGRLIGGRLSRVTEIPDGVFYGVMEAHAPRLQTERTDEALELARSNADRARLLLESAPQPRAVFVNDASIAFGHPSASIDHLFDYCSGADVAVINCYSGDEFADRDHPITRTEVRNVRRLRDWADTVIELE